MPATLRPFFAPRGESTSHSSSSSPNATPAQFVPILVIGIVIVLTIAGYFAYRAWKGRQMASSEPQISRQEKKLEDWYNGSDADSVIEKPRKAALAGDAEAYSGWTPQIHSWRGIPVQGAQLPSESNVGLARKGSLEKKKLPSFNLPSPQPSPPPTYASSTDSPKRSPEPLPGISLVPPPLEDSDDAPIPSPRRTSSMHPAITNIETENKSTPPTADDGLPLPRVMIVRNTFTPNLDDELPIVRGEAIRMLAEYKDGWCVVQRIGPYDSPKGVVPRSCLQERQELARRS